MNFKEFLKSAELAESNINEAANDGNTTEDLAKELEKIFLKKFPNGLVNISRGALRKDIMYCSFFLISDKNDQTSKLFVNDPLTLQISIGKVDDQNPKYEIEFLKAWVSTEPTEKHYAMGSKKLSVRKIKGNYDNVLGKFSNTVDKLHATLKEIGTDLYRYDKIPQKYINF